MKSIENPPVSAEKAISLDDLDLFLFLNDAEIKKLVEKVNNEEYLYWDKVKYQELPEGVSHEKFWKGLVVKREFNSQQVEIGNHKFKYVITNHIAKSLHEFDMKFGGNINLDGTIPDLDKRQYLISSIMEEAIASSQIEGAVTTRKKAKEMLRKNLPPRNTSEQMILNNFQSINQLSKYKNKKLTPELLLDIHKSITEKTLDHHSEEGSLRATDDINVVDSTDNETVYIPPPFTEVKELVQHLCDYFNKEDEETYIHPIVKGCIIHFLVGWIHPFTDGNGRTARALFYWYLLSKGYWLIEYMSISRLIIKSKTQYAMAYLYTEKDRNDLTYFITYKIRTLHLAFNSLHIYLQKKIKEKKQFQIIRKVGHINERQAEIIRILYDDDRTLSVKELEELFGVANQTVRNDLKGLLEKNILTEIPLNKKTVYYGRGKKFLDFISTSLGRNK